MSKALADAIIKNIETEEYTTAITELGYDTDGDSLTILVGTFKEVAKYYNFKPTAKHTVEGGTSYCLAYASALMNPDKIKEYLEPIYDFYEDSQSNLMLLLNRLTPVIMACKDGHAFPPHEEWIAKAKAEVDSKSETGKPHHLYLVDSVFMHISTAEGANEVLAYCHEKGMLDKPLTVSTCKEYYEALKSITDKEDMLKPSSIF